MPVPNFTPPFLTTRGLKVGDVITISGEINLVRTHDEVRRLREQDKRPWGDDGETILIGPYSSVNVESENVVITSKRVEWKSWSSRRPSWLMEVLSEEGRTYLITPDVIKVGPIRAK
jgi:hypothetical protein